MIYASRLLKVTLLGTRSFFLNSLSFFPGSLEKMGKLIGHHKLPGDAFSKKYVIRDAEIPQRFMVDFQKRLHALGVNLGVSIGQIAMSAYRANFMPEKEIGTFNDNLCLKAYYGGRVEMFYKGGVKDLHVVDIKSSYPDVMRNKFYPDTSLISESTIHTHEFGVGEFTIFVPKMFLPPLPFRHLKSGRLYFPTGTITGHWTYAEVRLALSVGCSIIKEAPGFGTNASISPFTHFVDHFWEEREAAQKAGKEFDSFYLKLLMNNLYGKFAQHKDLNVMTRTRWTQKRLEKEEGAEEGHIGPFFNYTIPRKKPPATANYMWGCYITSYARISLYEKMQKVMEAGGQLVYCDTDSVMFTRDTKGLDIGNSLGQLSHEFYDLGIFRQSKGYLLCNHLSSILATKEKEFHIVKVACKGVPQHSAHDFIMQGVAFFRKPFRLKEGLVRTHAKANKNAIDISSKLGVNVWDDVKKQMNGIYIKRSINMGVTQPIDVEDIPKQEAMAFDTVDSFTDHLGGVKIRKEERLDTFANVVIPKNWFKKSGFEKADSTKEKFFYLKQASAIGVPEGETWVRGLIKSLHSGKYGAYFKINLTEFSGENCVHKNLTGAFPTRFFEGFDEDEIFIGKIVDVSMRDEYIGRGDFNVKITLTDLGAKNPARKKPPRIKRKG